MPPELFDDKDLAGETNLLKIDVYALGVILWQLWFKLQPYAGMSLHKILHQVMKGKRLSLLPEPRTRNERDSVTVGHLLPPPALAALIGRCWAQDPAARPPLAEVFEAFQAALPAVRALPGEIGSREIGSGEGNSSSGDSLGVAGSVVGQTTNQAQLAAALAAEQLIGNNGSVDGSGGGGAARTTKGATAMAAFLGAAGLGKHAPALVALGFTDVETLSDRGNNKKKRARLLSSARLALGSQLFWVAGLSFVCPRQNSCSCTRIPSSIQSFSSLPRNSNGHGAGA
jgi:hypothetical protein